MKTFGLILALIALLLGGRYLFQSRAKAAEAPAGGQDRAAAAPGTAAPQAAPAGGPAKPAPGGAGAAGPSLPVAAKVLREERLESRITGSGTVMANEEVEIRSEVQGKIRRIAFREGARVAKGALLVKIDDAELQAKVLQATSSRKLAEDNEHRMRKQLEIEAVSRRDYEASVNELNRAKSEAQLLRAQLEKTELRAPFAGVVGLKQVSEGAYVSPSTLITVLQQLDPVKIDFTVPGKYAGWVKPGQTVTFGVQGSEARHQGTIYAVDPRIDPATRTLRIRAQCPNPAGALLPGAFATVDLPLQAVDAALMVPAQAVSMGARGASVFVFKGGKAEPRPVQAGLRTDSAVQITGGLRAGDTVIVSGAVAIRPGSPVVLSRVE